MDTQPWSKNAPIMKVFDYLQVVEKFAVSLCVAFLGIVLLFSISVAANATTASAGFMIMLRTFSVCGATIFGASATGALLGFLFGIPRMLQRPQNAQSAVPSTNLAPPSGNNMTTAGDRFFRSNTSFEEISDWLTKIIIGLGLVQFDKIIEYLSVAARYSAAYINLAPIPASPALPDGTIAVSVTFALIVTALFSSCLVSYLETRTRLAALFSQMEAADDAAAKENIADSFNRPISDRGPADANSTVGNMPEPMAKPATSVDQNLINVPLSGMKSPIEVAAWGAAQARTGNMDKAQLALTQATTEAPDNAAVRLKLAQVLRLRGEISAYIQVVLETIKVSPKDPAVTLEARSA